MDSTISNEIKATLGKTYGELDGGTANYYRHVKVCRNCFTVYTMLDAARYDKSIDVWKYLDACLDASIYR